MVKKYDRVINALELHWKVARSLQFKPTGKYGKEQEISARGYNRGLSMMEYNLKHHLDFYKKLKREAVSTTKAK